MSRQVTETLAPRNPRAQSTQFCRTIQATEINTVARLKQQCERLGGMWEVIHTRTGTLELRSSSRRTLQGSSRVISLKYLPKTTSKKKQYGVSIFLQLQQYPSAVDSVLRNIRPYTVQSSSASVFQYIKEGNVSELDKCFSSGQASIIDHDEQGWGLLVVSIVPLSPSVLGT
jgi:hypothetical protein